MMKNDLGNKDIKMNDVGVKGLRESVLIKRPGKNDKLTCRVLQYSAGIIRNG